MAANEPWQEKIRKSQLDIMDALSRKESAFRDEIVSLVSKPAAPKEKPVSKDKQL